MTIFTNRALAATLTSVPLATAAERARARIAPGWLSRAAMIIGDVFAAVGIALCIPFVILAIGTPVALCVRLLVWIVGMF